MSTYAQVVSQGTMPALPAAFLNAQPQVSTSLTTSSAALPSALLTATPQIHSPTAAANLAINGTAPTNSNKRKRPLSLTATNLALAASEAAKVHERDLAIAALKEVDDDGSWIRTLRSSYSHCSLEKFTYWVKIATKLARAKRIAEREARERARRACRDDMWGEPRGPRGATGCRRELMEGSVEDLSRREDWVNCGAVGDGRLRAEG